MTSPLENTPTCSHASIFRAETAAGHQQPPVSVLKQRCVASGVRPGAGESGQHSVPGGHLSPRQACGGCGAPAAACAAQFLLGRRWQTPILAPSASAGVTQLAICWASVGGHSTQEKHAGWAADLAAPSKSVLPLTTRGLWVMTSTTLQQRGHLSSPNLLLCQVGMALASSTHARVLPDACLFSPTCCCCALTH